MQENIIKNIANEFLEGTDKFLVEVAIKPVNRIYVYIDGDRGVTISDCADLSRHIESKMDRESEDYELTVSSAGADQPIRMARQYLKNVGRKLKVKMPDDKSYTGTLLNAGQDSITLRMDVKGKKKPESEIIELPIRDIVETKVVLSFK